MNDPDSLHKAAPIAADIKGADKDRVWGTEERPSNEVATAAASTNNIAAALIAAIKTKIDKELCYYDGMEH